MEGKEPQYLSFCQHPILHVCRLSDSAKLPEYKTSGAAGMDLYASCDMIISPQSTMLVDTGISVAWDNTKCPYYLRIAPRSSVSMKGILTNAGVIDSDYRGEIKVCLTNLSTAPFIISKGQGIAQAILEQIGYCNVVEVDTIDKLGKTERGDGGFGSTDKNPSMDTQKQIEDETC